MSDTSLYDRGLEILGKRRLLLSIHDPSFPSTPDEDIGRGTPYGSGGYRFSDFIRSIGFNGIQMGPQGRTSRGNPSPYDGTAFSRNFLSISFPLLKQEPNWGVLVDPSDLDEALRLSQHDEAAPLGSPDRTRHREAYDIQTRLLGIAYDRMEERFEDGTLDPQPFEQFCRENRDWLEPDALYQALVTVHDSVDWRTWPNHKGDRSLYATAVNSSRGRGITRGATHRRRKKLLKEHHAAIERYQLSQYVAHYQHARYYEYVHSIGLRLFADLQVGLSLRDHWRLQSLFLNDYTLGAPPSRTNADGQPWGYPILNPITCRGGSGPGADYVRSRAGKIFQEFDGIRIDHPQGLVCPWVYRSEDPDQFHAVQHGARLFSSPNLSDHPDLAPLAIARPDQLTDDESVPRYADPWVTDLDDDQVDRYATLLSVIVAEARKNDCDTRDVACETLSTQPYPLKRVMEKYGLGRFRVTQKMNVHRPDDPYRTDLAGRSDWMMMGNHDTPSIWAVVERWKEKGEIPERAAYLARRLKSGDHAPAFQKRLLSDTNLLVQALFADILVSDSENIVVFFTDLIGSRETYNAPGTVGPENWSLRLPPDYQQQYRKKAPTLQALNIAYAIALALESPLVGDPEAVALARELRHLSGVSRDRRIDLHKN